MINKLTKEQESKLVKYKDKWLKVGLSIEKCDRNKAQLAAIDVYKSVGLPAPKIFIWLRSPLEGVFGSYFLTKMPSIAKAQVRDQVGAQVRDQVWDQVWDQVRAQVRAQVWAQVRAQVWAQVGAQVRDQVWDQVGDQVRDQVRDQVGDQVRAQVRDQVWAQVGAQVRDQVRDQVGAQVRAQVWDQVGAQVWAQVGAQVNKAGFGLHDAGWLGFYEFFKNEVMLDCTKKLEPLIRLAEHSGWWWPFANAVIFTEKPIAIYRDEQNRLHADGKMAIEYSDGFGIWALHGVRVPKYLAETPDGQLNIEFFKKENNADIRAEFIRKYGIDRMQSLGSKICDAKNHKNEWFRKSEYELIDMGSVFNVNYAPHLRMKNLTTGIWHFEAVSPECKTIEDALKFRTKKKNINLQGVA